MLALCNVNFSRALTTRPFDDQQQQFCSGVLLVPSLATLALTKIASFQKHPYDARARRVSRAFPGGALSRRAPLRPLGALDAGDAGDTR